MPAKPKDKDKEAKLEAIKVVLAACGLEPDVVVSATAEIDGIIWGS